MLHKCICVHLRAATTALAHGMHAPLSDDALNAVTLVSGVVACEMAILDPAMDDVAAGHVNLLPVTHTFGV